MVWWIFIKILAMPEKRGKKFTLLGFFTSGPLLNNHVLISTML